MQLKVTIEDLGENGRILEYMLEDSNVEFDQGIKDTTTVNDVWRRLEATDDIKITITGKRRSSSLGHLTRPQTSSKEQT